MLKLKLLEYNQMCTDYCYLDDVALAIAIALTLNWPWYNQEKTMPRYAGKEMQGDNRRTAQRHYRK